MALVMMYVKPLCMTHRDLASIAVLTRSPAQTQHRGQKHAEIHSLLGLRSDLLSLRHTPPSTTTEPTKAHPSPEPPLPTTRLHHLVP